MLHSKPDSSILSQFRENGEEVELVGDFGVSGYMAGLAYDARDDILYGSTTAGDNLYTINRLTGHATLVGPLGVGLMHALAFDNATGTLYGGYGGNGGLYRINTATGGATLIGIVGFALSGMSFDPFTHVLYGCSYAPGDTHLLTIDPATGHANQISTLALNGLSFNPETGCLYGINNGALGLAEGLYTIDLPSGTASLVGSLSLGNPLDLQFVGVPEPGTVLLVHLCVLTLMVRRHLRHTAPLSRSWN